MKSLLYIFFVNFKSIFLLKSRSIFFDGILSLFKFEVDKIDQLKYGWQTNVKIRHSSSVSYFKQEAYLINL